MRTLRLLPFAGLLVGCDDPATKPNTADFGGVWRYVENMTDVRSDIACTANGVYRLNQMGTMFHGDYVQEGLCTTPEGPIDNSDSGGVANGVVIGRTIRFRASQYCDYDGALDHATGRLTGRALCILVGGGDSIHLIGTWSATRPAP